MGNAPSDIFLWGWFKNVWILNLESVVKPSQKGAVVEEGELRKE